MTDHNKQRAEQFARCLKVNKKELPAIPFDMVNAQDNFFRTPHYGAIREGVESKECFITILKRGEKFYPCLKPPEKAFESWEGEVLLLPKIIHPDVRTTYAVRTSIFVQLYAYVAQKIMHAANACKPTPQPHAQHVPAE